MIDLLTLLTMYGESGKTRRTAVVNDQAATP